MKKCVVFYGKERETYGMPIPFRFYAIFVSHYSSNSNYLAVSTLGFLVTHRSETDGSTLVLATSEEDALELAIEKLRSHPSNTELTMQVSDGTERHL